MNQDDAGLLALEIGCITATLPFPYLGLPMGITKPTIKDMSPLIDRVERRLSATASFLSYGDRLVLVNSMISSMPLHYLCSLEIPKGVFEVINRAIRHCLWRKKKEDGRINSLASWDMICKPKVKGG